MNIEGLFWIAVVLIALLVGVIVCLCRAKNEAEEAWEIIHELRAGFGSVNILCDNEEADMNEEQTAVEVSDEWTGWNDRRFYGRTVLDALKKALQAKGEAK